MKLAWLFGILTLVFLILFICYLDLIFFFFRERKRFFKAGGIRMSRRKTEHIHVVVTPAVELNDLLYIQAVDRGQIRNPPPDLFLFPAW